MEVSKRKGDGEDPRGGDASVVLAKKARVSQPSAAIVVVSDGISGRADGDGVLVAKGEGARLSNLPEPTMQLVGHGSEVYALDFSAEGNVLATASFDRTLMLWNIAGGCNATAVLRGHRSAVSDVRWLRDNEHVVSASADTTAALWDVVTEQRVKQFKGHSGVVHAVAVARSQSGNGIDNVSVTLATASEDRTVRLWDQRRRGRQAVHTLKHDYQVLAVCFGDDYALYTGGVDGYVCIWDVRRPENPSLQLRGHGNAVTGLDVNAAGTHLVSNSMDDTCRVWDVRPFVEGGDEKRAVSVLTGHHHAVERNLLRCRWASDGRTVAAGSGDRTVWIWNGLSGEVLYRLPGHRGSVNDVCFHPKQPVIGSASSDRTVYLGEIKMTTT